MTESSEKRRFNRFTFQEPVLVFPVLPSQSGNIYEVQRSSIEARAHDISEGGLRLEVDRPLNSNFVLKLNFAVEKSEPVEVYGKIVWSEKNHCGIRFMLADSTLRKGIRSIGRKPDSVQN